MIRRFGIFISILATALSISVFASAGWLWHRSMRCVDLLARMEPAPEHQSRLHGMGSYKGAVLFGSISEPKRIEGATRFEHGVIPMATGQGGQPAKSLLKVVPETKTGGLGFGKSRGELRVELPFLSFMKPPSRKYDVVYVPYYFVMLLGLVQPARVGWRFARPRAGVKAG